MNSKTPPKQLELEFGLLDLPSAQHKAGLAGLLLLIESLRRRQAENLPEIVDGPSATHVAIRLTEASLKTIYDDFFAPVVLQVPDGKDKTKSKEFPKAEFMEVLGLPKPWLGLWRDIIRNVLRAGAPAQFKPFRDRMPDSNMPKSWDWQKMWQDLAKEKVSSLSASDYLGAESVTAERVPFQDHAKYAFLLTFAPIVSLPFISQSLTRSSKAGETSYRFQRNAFVIATPEVSRLDEYVEGFPRQLAELNVETLGKNPYPRQAFISIPEEGGLEFLSSLRLASEKASKTIDDCASGVQITHLKYGKGSPSLQHIGMLHGSPSVLNQYEQIRSHCWNLFFRELLIRNLLDRRPWFFGADQLFGDHPVEIFVQKRGSPQLYFDSDAKRKFSSIRTELIHSKGNEKMVDDWPDKQLADEIYRLTQTYVNRRTSDRCHGATWDDYKNGKCNKQEFREAREKICQEVFLALRGRDNEEVVSYFVGTLCSVPQNLNQQKFLTVSQQLLTDPLKVKTLAMLALSAHSHLWDSETKSSKNS